MPTKIRNVELLTLARSDAGTPVLGHVGVGIDANLIQDFEMGLSRVSSAAQFNLALNTEGATTNTAHFGGIAFTQGASADTVMASIKAVNTSVDGYIDLAFNTRSVDNALLIKANGDVSINNANASLTINATSSYPFINFEENGTVRFQQAYDITNDLAYFICNQSGSQMWFGVNNAEVMRLSDGKVGIGTGATPASKKLEINAGDILLSNIGLNKYGLLFGEGANQTMGLRYDGTGSNGNLEIVDASNNLLVNFEYDGKVGIGTGSSALTSNLTVQASDQADLLIGSTGGARALLILDGSANGDGLGGDYAYLAHETDGRLTIANSHAGNVITLDGNVGIGTGSTTLTELLEVNGNAKATKFIGALEGNADTATALETARTIHGVSFDGTGNIDLTEVVQDTVGAMFTSNTETGITVAYQDSDGTIDLTVGTLNQDTTGNAATATTLETTRAITIGPNQAASQHDRAGDIAQLSQNFNGSAAIQFNSKLESHLYNSVDNKTSTINKTTGINIAAEPSNDDVIIIGSDINTPQLKINKQGLVVGFKEVATTGSSGSGGISAITVNTNGLLYLNSDLSLQTTTTSDSTPTINFYLKAADLFTELKISEAVGYVGDLEIEVGGTTKYLTLPDASFTTGGLSLIGDPANTLQVIIGGSTQTLDLGGLSVTSAGSATNATNANNIATAADNANLTRYLTFVASSSGTQSLLTNTGITYNPSTNTLATTNFSGALSGNATTSSGLLVGTTTYTPSNSADGGVSLVSRNSSNEVSIAKLILSDNTITENIDVIVGKVSDSDLLYEFTASQVRSFIDPDDSLFLPTPSSVDGVNIYPLTVSNATSAGSATNAGSAVSISAGEGNQAFSGVTNNGFVKLSTADDGTKGVLAVGPLLSGDIPNNAADTSGNAATANEAETLTLGENAVAANLTATENTVVVRGANGVVNVGNLFCANIGSSDNAAGDITAESLTVTNATNSVVAKEIMPRGTASDNLPIWMGQGNAGVSSYSVSDSKLGDHTDSNKGAFYEASFLHGFTKYSNVMSDRRIKENIESFGLGLDFVRLLEPKKYNYIGSSSPRVHHGVVAQEIEEALDALGVENHSFINIPSYHEKSEEEKEKVTKSYNPQDVMWVLFNAVKQLDAKVQELEKQLDKSE